MIIKKFYGKTEAMAREAAKAELGDNAVVMNVKTIKPTGLFSVFKSPSYEITAAIEDVKPEPIKRFYDLAKEKSLAQDANTPESDVKVASPTYSKPVPRTATENVSGQKSGNVSGKSVDGDNEQDLGKRIDKIQKLLEHQFKDDKKDAEDREITSEKKNNVLPIMERIEEKLSENEVDPKYIRQIMEEVKKAIPANAGIDTVLSAVYQRVILKFGQPEGINLSGRKPKVVFFIGPTGVGKTTTIAKIASHYKVEQGKSIALLTADTYRIAATDQLRVYADILNAPLSIIYSAEELNEAVNELSSHEIILVDTAGFSHKNMPQKDEMQALLDSLDERFDKEVYLVVSATTKYKDLKDIVDAYTDFGKYKLIFTKLDETTAYGNLLNIHLYTGAPMSYSTNGQNVPDDIEVFNAQRLVKQLLGGK